MIRHPRHRPTTLAALVALVASVLAVSLQTSTLAVAESPEWRQISAGSAHTCGIRTDGRLFCWGRNTYGQLGDATTVERTVPTQAVSGFSDWTTVSAGYEHTCARRSTGRIYCWGRNNVGQVGDGGTTNRITPTPVGSWTNWTSVSAGGFHTCARRTNGRLYCWGYNGDGQLGNGTTTLTLHPVQVARGWTNWTSSIATGTSHTCARRGNGRLYCWGFNGDGQLGDGTTATRLVPRQVARHWANWTTVTGGEKQTCARRGNRRLYCWGGNEDGQLGDGTIAQRNRPTQVAGHWASWTPVSSAGGEHSCALRSRGRLYCWGNNSDGHLGDGTLTARHRPTKVPGSRLWSKVSLGAYHTCAISRAKRAYCWGYNGTGQRGDGTTSSTATPTEVAAP